jgi:hypothetical protein
MPDQVLDSKYVFSKVENRKVKQVLSGDYHQ